MKSKTKIYVALFAFLFVAVLHIIGLFFDGVLAYYSKPLLMITLSFFYTTSSKKVNYWVLGALLFSFFGDVFLLDKANNFVLGLASFLIVHIFYIKLTSEELKKIKWQNVLVAALPFVFIFFGLMGVLYQNLNDMLLPVIVYGIVISTFGALALAVYREEKLTENLWLLIGATLFILSDSLIAINKFYLVDQIHPSQIMVTYIVAQFLICKSFIAKSHSQ